MCVKLNLLFDTEMKEIKTMCPNYKLEFKYTKSLLVEVYLGAWAKIETVVENHVC